MQEVGGSIPPSSTIPINVFRLKLILNYYFLIL